ncbi:MAG: hypothetical protein KF822_09775 [Steroidobacteraceae bacterium]|nr:hypothetical protein [Steroidobacteraceae bacterium]
MTSFALEIEPAAQPRLAALLTLGHALAAACPWLANCPTGIAAAASLLALGGLWATLCRVPGARGRLQALRLVPSGCQVRLSGAAEWQPATLTPGTRAWAGLVAIEVRLEGTRAGWLLPRQAVTPDQFRRLKALIRLAC